jgi:putative oxidoreductase
MDAFNQWWGIPHAVTFLVILSDSAGACSLMLGFLTRFVSASIGLVMLGAIYFAHGRWGFYMNWYGEPRGEGFEFHLLVLGIVSVLVLRGGGRWSIDRMILHRLVRGKEGSTSVEVP